MYHGSQGGWIEVIAGVMFSGKSEELIRRVRRATIARKQVQVFKSQLDDRDGNQEEVDSHDGATLEALSIAKATDVMRHLRTDSEVIAVDEVQFLDEGIVGVATELAATGHRVILAGTETDFRGEPFAAMPVLMAIAETVDKLYAICVVCGDPACRNQRLVDRRPAPYESPTILVGGLETYEARCRHCHEVPGVAAGQTQLFQDQHS